VPEAGSAIAGDWIDVAPPSTSFADADEPARTAGGQIARSAGGRELLGAVRRDGLRHTALPPPGRCGCRYSRGSLSIPWSVSKSSAKDDVLQLSSGCRASSTTGALTVTGATTVS
jgi:hypothetical protein